MVRDALTVDTRVVRLALMNGSRTSDGIGNTFVPDTLNIEYRDGALSFVSLVGPKLRADGNPYLTETAGRRVFMQAGTVQSKLSDDTPEWVRELVTRYEPQ